MKKKKKPVRDINRGNIQSRIKAYSQDQKIQLGKSDVQRRQEIQYWLQNLITRVCVLRWGASVPAVPENCERLD